VLAVAVAAGAHPTPPRGNGSEGGSTGRRRRRGSSSGAPVPLSLSPSLRWRQLWGTARWRRWWRGGGQRPRRWGGVCGVCVRVCARFEGETAVLNVSVYRVPRCTALGKLKYRSPMTCGVHVYRVPRSTALGKHKPGTLPSAQIYGTR